MRLSPLVSFLAASSLLAAPVAAQIRPSSSLPEHVVAVDRTGAQLQGKSAFVGDEPLGLMHYLGGAVIIGGVGYLISSLLLKGGDDEAESPE